jgi:hypothetical protein
VGDTEFALMTTLRTSPVSAAVVIVVMLSAGSHRVSAPTPLEHAFEWRHGNLKGDHEHQHQCPDSGCLAEAAGTNPKDDLTHDAGPKQDGADMSKYAMPALSNARRRQRCGCSSSADR